jgi:hypothetical protein
MPLTVIFSVVNSSASARVRPSNPCFADA